MYRGSYARRAREVRRYAEANPEVRCWRCGLTMEQARAIAPGKKITWDAGHVNADDPGSALRPEHSTCNRAAGAATSNRAQQLNPSRKWY